MRSLKYYIMMWTLNRKFANENPQAHSRQTESRTVHSQHHSRHWQGSHGSGRVTSTMGIDPFELRRRELDAEIDDHLRRNGHPRGSRSTGFDRVNSNRSGPPPWLSYAELLQWQRDHRNASYDDRGRLGDRRATRPTGFNQVGLHFRRLPDQYGELRELLRRERESKEGSSHDRDRLPTGHSHHR